MQKELEFLWKENENYKHKLDEKLNPIEKLGTSN